MARALALNPFLGMTKQITPVITTAITPPSPQDLKLTRIGNTVHGFFAALEVSGHLSLYHMTSTYGSTYPFTCAVDPSPVIHYGQQSGLDEILVSAAVPIAMPDGSFRLYYHSYNGVDRGCVATATAQAFPTFTPYPGNPTINVVAGHWDSAFIHTEVIIPPWDSPNGLWCCVFASGAAQTDAACRGGLATSVDGLTGWTENAGNPLVVLGPNGMWNGTGIHPAGGYLHIYDVWYILAQGWNGTTWQIGAYATPDLLSYYTLPNCPFISPTPGNWDSGAIENPGVLRDPTTGKTDLFYTSAATFGSGAYSIGYATNQP